MIGHREEGHLRHSGLVTALDGLMATVAFTILVIVAGFNVLTNDAMPRSADHAVVVSYTVIELIVVVASALVAIVYR